MEPCWSCGARNEPCAENCVCAKCVDPDGHVAERADRRTDEYADWLESVHDAR